MPVCDKPSPDNLKRNTQKSNDDKMLFKKAGEHHIVALVLDRRGVGDEVDHRYFLSLQKGPQTILRNDNPDWYSALTMAFCPMVTTCQIIESREHSTSLWKDGLNRTTCQETLPMFPRDLLPKQIHSLRPCERKIRRRK